MTTYYRYKLKGSEEIKTGTVPHPSSEKQSTRAIEFISQEIADKENGVVSLRTNHGNKCAYPKDSSLDDVTDIPLIEFDLIQFSMEGNKWFDLDPMQ